MKTKLNQVFSRVLGLCLLAGATALHAADGSWAVDADGAWSTAGNWLSSTIADASGSTANFTNPITVGRTVTSDTARTIGNLVFAGSAALNWTLTNSAALTLATGSGVSTITVTSNTATINASGAGLAGAQTVLKNGAGILSLAWNNTYSGGTMIGEGRVNLATVNSGQFGTGSVTITNNSILALIRADTTDSATVSGSLTNTLVVPTGQTATILSQPRGSISGTLTGGGTLNLRVNATRGDIGGNWSAFTGQINVTSRTGGDDLRLPNGNGFTSGKLNLASGVNMYYTPNPPNNTVGIDIPIGELSGAAGSTIQCGTGLGRYVNYNIGGLNTSTTFAGNFSTTSSNGYSRLIKNGTGTFTLTGNNTFYSPLPSAVTVNAGKLVLATSGSISNSPITVAASATNSILIASAGGQTTETNAMFRPSSVLEFNFATLTPSTTVPPLQVLGTLGLTNSVTLAVVGGVWAPGSYPLAKYSGTLGGDGFGALVLGTQPLRVSGVLSNDTVNSRIWYVVSAVNTPLKWAVGNANWDIATGSNWKDAANVVTTYQEQLGLGDQTLFDDTATGSSPITVTLNTGVTPASVTFSNVAKNYVLTGTSNILGGVGLTKTGAGTLTIQNTNSFTGAVSLNGGVVNFNSLNNNFGGGTAINFGGGTLQYASGNTADISARTVTINAGGATIDTAGNNVAFANRIGNGGAGGLTKAGAGTLTLNTNGTYTGITVVSNGVLALGANTSLSNSAAVIVNAGTTLDASATGFGFNLNGTGGQLLAGNGAVSGAVTTSGGSKLSPATNGTIGMLTFNNALTLNGGTFNLDVNNGSRDLIAVSGSLNLNATVSGTVQINALALLTLNSTNKIFQYPAGQLTGGGVSTLSLAVSGVAQSGRLLSLDNSVDGEIDLVVHAAPANNLIWQGGLNGNTWDITTANWLGAGGIYSDGDNANFTDAGAANSPVNISPSAVTPNSVTFNATLPYTVTGAKITGPATVTKTNSGTVILANVGNDYGLTVIKGGTLQIGDGSTAGTSIGQGTVTNNASLVFNQPDNSSVLGDVTGAGSLSKQGAGTLSLLGNNTYAGATTVDTGVLQIGNGGTGGTLSPAAVALSNGGTLDLNHSGTYSLANGVSGAGTLKFDGAATVTLGGVNSYLNNTYINNGIVKLSAANVIPSGGSTTGWLILDGGASAAGALDLNGFNQSANALSGVTGTVQGRIYNNGSGQNTLTLGTIASTTYAGLILNNTNGGSGSVALTVTGDGSLSTALTLSGANSYSGPVLITGASVIMGGSIGTIGQQSIGTGAITLTNNGSLQMNGYGNATQSGNFVNSILVPAGTTGNLKMVGRGNDTGSLTVHGTLNLTMSYIRGTPTGDWSASDGQINIIAGSLPQNGLVNVYWNNAGNWSLGTAAVDIGAGVYFVNSANTGPAGNTITIGELTGLGTITDCDSTAGRVTTYAVGGRNSDATFAGVVRNDHRITALNKVGSGKWTLTGSVTNTGATTVSGGSLIVGPNSFMTNSTPITVSSGAIFDVSSYAGLSLAANQTLAGSGVVTGAVTAVASDILSPGVGTAAGTLSFSNTLAIDGTSGFVTNNFNLSSDPTGISRTNSQIVVAGDLNVTGANVVTINPLNAILGAGTYTLFKYTGTLMTNGVAAGADALPNNFSAGGAFVANAHVTLTFSNTANKEVVMIVTPNGSSLVWQGGVFGTATNNWDLNLSTNWLAGAAVTNFLTYDNTTFDNTATNFNAVVAGTIAPGAVTVNSTNAFTFSGTGKISGTTGITKSGTNVLTISNTGGNDFTGTVTINNGAVKAGSATALGATNGATVISGTGALDIGGQNLGAEPVTVSGSGSGGAGAIQNSGAAALNALQFVTLAGNTTFGGTNRWDIRANTNGSLAGGGFTLTKTSTNDIYLVGLGNTALGNIQIQSGRFGVQDNTLLGSGSALTLWPGAGLDFWLMTVTNTKAISLTNATVSSSSGTNVYGGPINLNGAGTFTATTPLQLNGVLGGTGGLVKNGASPLALTAANTFSGTTTISNGNLALIGTASIASSPAIEIEAGAVLDVIGHTGGSITLASGQTLRGNGTVSGSVSAPAGSTVSPGVGGTGTLTVTNTITLGGTTLMDVNHDVVPARDQIVATNIVFGGTLTVVQSGTALTLGDFFKLFVGANSGSFATINLPALDPGLAWTNTIALNGTISVVAGPSVNLAPTNIVSVVNGNNLELSWPSDHTGWKLQAQTNTVSVGLGANWVTIPGTDTVNHFTNTINPANGSVFYRLVSP
jgi:autotransporter-associated beta strand protein